jgi:hypothetical protein
MDSVRERNIRVIKALCQRHSCSEKIRKIHYDQAVYRGWDPHPSQEFVNWWHTHSDFKEHGIDAVRARNCKSYCDEYKEAVSMGLAELPIDFPR